MPSNADALKISELTKDLKMFHSISLMPQKCDSVVNLAAVQSLFDKLIADFGDDFKLYLSPDAEIVNNKFFESGIVEVLQDELNLSEERESSIKGIGAPLY